MYVETSSLLPAVTGYNRESKKFLDCSTLEIWIDSLSRNVGTELPFFSTENPRRTWVSDKSVAFDRSETVTVYCPVTLQRKLHVLSSRCFLRSSFVMVPAVNGNI